MYQTMASKLTNFADQSGSLLLGLPRELRDIIYGLVFEGECFRHTCPSLHFERIPHSVGLLLTCKQIHVEAINIYYRQVTPTFSGRNSLAEWAKRLPVTYLQQIHTITCELYAHCLDIIAALQGFPMRQFQDIRNGLLSNIHGNGVSLRDGQLSLVLTTRDGKWYPSCHTVRHRAYF